MYRAVQYAVRTGCAVDVFQGDGYIVLLIDTGQALCSVQ